MRKPIKPPALVPGSTVRVIAPASAAKQPRVERGCRNLEELSYRVKRNNIKSKPDGYFAAPLKERLAEFQDAFTDPDSRAVFCTRGGGGSAMLLDRLKIPGSAQPRIFCGFSDITSLHIFLWQTRRWVTFYGPLVAGGFDAGPNATCGYDSDSFERAVSVTKGGWTIPLRGETLVRGTASATVLGGCITLVQTSIGTDWELDTRGSILLLEDRGVKPYQLERMLVHLVQAGKFKGVRGIVLGEFPECETPEGSDVDVLAVCTRVLSPLRIPIVYGAPIGHTLRPVLTVPLGIRARLIATGEGRLEMLEPAVRK